MVISRVMFIWCSRPGLRHVDLATSCSCVTMRHRPTQAVCGTWPDFSERREPEVMDEMLYTYGASGLVILVPRGYIVMSSSSGGLRGGMNGTSCRCTMERNQILHTTHLIWWVLSKVFESSSLNSSSSGNIACQVVLVIILVWHLGFRTLPWGLIRLTGW